MRMLLLLLRQDPYFNEPNVERMRGTGEGNITSMRCAANSQNTQHSLYFAVLASASVSRHSFVMLSVFSASISGPSEPLYAVHISI
jgi:hypothetical protein